MMALFAPSIIVWAFWVWIPFVVLNIFNILFNYGKIIVQGSGVINRKAILIVFGLLFTFATIAMRDFVQPELIAHIIGVFAAFVLYNAIKMEI